MNERRILANGLYTHVSYIKYAHTSTTSIYNTHVMWKYFASSGDDFIYVCLDKAVRLCVHIIAPNPTGSHSNCAILLSRSLSRSVFIFFPETLANENSNLVSFQLALMNPLSCSCPLRAEKQIQNFISMHTQTHYTSRIPPSADDCRIAASEQNW